MNVKMRCTAFYSILSLIYSDLMSLFMLCSNAGQNAFFGTRANFSETSNFSVSSEFFFIQTIHTQNGTLEVMRALVTS